MRVIRCLLLGLFLLGSASVSVVAVAETVRLGTFHIPLLVESKDTVLFVEVAKRVAQDVGVDLDIVLLPTHRTREAFAQGELDGFFPALSNTLTVPYNATVPYSTKRIYAYTRKDEPLVRSAQDLTGRQVGYTDGFTYPDSLLSVPGATYQTANTDPQNLRKLLAGRIDVFLAEQQSAKAGISQVKGEGIIVHDDARPLAVFPIFFAFQPNDRGRDLAGRFTAAIRSLNERGEISRIMDQP